MRLAMGHQEATVDDYSESRDALLEDMMYFPSRQVYNLASVASMTDRLSAFQSEFDIVKKHMEGETKKVAKVEQKLKVLMQGYQVFFSLVLRQLESMIYKCTFQMVYVNHSSKKQNC